MKNPQGKKTAAKGGASHWPIGSYSHTKDSGQGRFALTHFWMPCALFAVLILVSMGLHGDQVLAGWLYAWQGHRWALRDSFLAEKVIHILGRDLSLAAWLCVLTAWVVACSRANLAKWRTPLAYLTLSTLLATALVAWVKSWSNMDCPWDLQSFGGAKPYVSLFALRPVGLARGVCFPAGHASGGYAWMSLYFFSLLTRPTLRWYGLATAIMVGLLFGITQQLRGAHFFSHDVWTAAICWITVLGMYLLFRDRLERAAHEHRWSFATRRTRTQ